MTETFPIDDTHAVIGNGRCACTSQRLTVVAHLNITLVSHIQSHSVTNTERHLVKMLLPIYEWDWCDRILSEGQACIRTYITV